MIEHADERQRMGLTPALEAAYARIRELEAECDALKAELAALYVTYEHDKAERQTQAAFYENRTDEDGERIAHVLAERDALKAAISRAYYELDVVEIDPDKSRADVLSILSDALAAHPEGT